MEFHIEVHCVFRCTLEFFMIVTSASISRGNMQKYGSEIEFLIEVQYASFEVQ